VSVPDGPLLGAAARPGEDLLRLRNVGSLVRRQERRVSLGQPARHLRPSVYAARALRRGGNSIIASMAAGVLIASAGMRWAAAEHQGEPVEHRIAQRPPRPARDLAGDQRLAAGQQMRPLAARADEIGKSIRIDLDAAAAHPYSVNARRTRRPRPRAQDQHPDRGRRHRLAGVL
jgi:hypothetical protein